jgi:hypothetical protein
MRYHINKGASNRRHSTIITSDGLVVWATQAYSWAVGLQLVTVLHWTASKKIPVECINGDCGPTAEDIPNQQYWTEGRGAMIRLRGY